jgi:hypothetical protein
MRIGLSFFPPVRVISGPGPHDVKLDAFVTPEIVFHPLT